MSLGLLYAESAPAQGAAASGPMAQGGAFAQMLPLIIIFGIFYFLIIMPQQKKAKQHQKQLDALKKGDTVLTNGGLYGTVVALRGSVIELKIAEEVKVKIAKGSVASIVQGDPAAEPLPEAPAPK